MDGKEIKEANIIKLEVIIFFGERNRLCQLQLPVILLHQWAIYRNFGGGKSRSSDKFKRRIADKLPGEPKEGLLEVIVGLCGDLEVLQILFSVEGHLSSFHFSLLDINFVSAQHDRDVFADTFQIAMPVGNVLVRDSRCDVKHDDTTLALNIVSISETTKLLLTSSIPDVKADCAEVGREG